MLIPKDPKTGVVLHSADTCIGCQYCTWNCSYGVPQYNPERGVVGKCDMCHNRLDDGMAPACVSACPEGAIAIEIVNVAEWRRDYLSANAPGLPSADDSISTTRITLPENLVPDTGRVDLQRVGAGASALAAGLHAGAHAALRGRVRLLWLLDLLGRGAGLDDRGAGVAGARGYQPGSIHAASGAADLCVARAQRLAALLAQPRGADAFAVRRSRQRIRRNAVARSAGARLRRHAHRSSPDSRASLARRGFTSFRRAPRGSAATRSLNSISTALLLGPLFVQMLDGGAPAWVRMRRDCGRIQLS